MVFRVREPLLGGSPIEFEGFLPVPLHTIAFVVVNSEVTHRIRISGGGRLLQPVQAPLEVAFSQRNAEILPGQVILRRDIPIFRQALQVVG